jgi:hypothetical protein
VQNGKHIVLALVRAGSKGTLPKGVQRVEIDYESNESITSALQGQEFLVITLSINAPQGTHQRIVQAAAVAGVPYIMPDSFSNDIRDESLVREDLYSADSVSKCKEIEDAGSSYFAMVCGFWYQWSLALSPDALGFDIRKKKITSFDEGTTAIPMSTFELCGQALAKLLSLSESGAEVSLDMWKNKPLYVASFCLSQRDILDSLHRVLGDNDGDWDIQHESSRKRYDQAIMDLQ